VSAGQPNYLVVLAAATKKSITDLNNSNPVKLGVLQGSLGKPNYLVVLAAATKKSINDLNNSNPVKLGVLQGSLLYFCFFSKYPFLSDAPHKPLCNVYSGTLIVYSFIILYHVQTFSKHGDNIMGLCCISLFLSLSPFRFLEFLSSVTAVLEIP
jgi:hypothetical protein